jgi:lipoprotein-releasing system permease protein
MNARNGLPPYAPFIARRFLRSRRTGFLSLNSLLSALGFTLGVASLIVALALMSGFQNDVIERIMGANAHVFVYAADPAASLPAAELPGGLVDRALAVDGVVAAAPVVQGFAGMSARSGRIEWASIKGMTPEGIAALTELDRQMTAGSVEDLARQTVSGKPPIILGARLASRLAVLPGDPVHLILPRPRPMPWGPSVDQRVLEVVGTFETGFVEYDESWGLVSLDVGRDLYRAGDAAHRLEIRLSSIEQLRDVEASLAATLGPGYWIDDVMRQQSVFFSALRLEKLLMGLAVGLIVLVAALGVVSTLVLTVTQKTREIGVLVALGATPGGILRVFVLQGLSMGTLGTLLGALLGSTLCWLLDRFALIRLDPDVYYLDHLPFEVQAADLAWIVGLALATSLIATIYPALRAARLDPVEALRRE